MISSGLLGLLMSLSSLSTANKRRIMCVLGCVYVPFKHKLEYIKNIAHQNKRPAR